MTPHPTPRPFLVGALLFLMVLGAWPGSAGAQKRNKNRRQVVVTPNRVWTPSNVYGGCEVQVANRTPYRVLVYLDGVYWGWVNPHQGFVFRGVRPGKVVAYGTTQYSEYSWGPHALACSGQARWELSF